MLGLQILHGIDNLSLTMSVNSKQILSRSVSTGNNTIQFTDTELDNLYKEYGSSNKLTATFVLSGSGYTNSKVAVITLTGNQKTARLGFNNSVKRCKAFVCINGKIKKAVFWIGDKDKIPRRCI